MNENEGTVPVVAGSMDDLLAAQEKYQQEEAERQKVRQDAFFNMLGSLFGAVPALMHIKVQGYTPGFNDGDACEHSQCEPYLNGRGEYSGDNDEEIVGKYEALSDADYDNVCSIISGLDDVFEATFGTNWEITIERQQDGYITWKNEDYDCGY